MKYTVIEESVVGGGGFLSIRRLKLRGVRPDGSNTSDGLYDVVERPVGTDAVIVVLWSERLDGEVQVLLRSSVRIPLIYGRSDGNRDKPKPIREVIAGILEAGEAESDSAIRDRAAKEADEEAGIQVNSTLIEPLGPPMFPTPGMCGERFHFRAAQLDPRQMAATRQPSGDGSPFEEGATLEWVGLDDAMLWIRRGDIVDLKTEVALRRLAEGLANPKSLLRRR
jgi:ADP-ribose pyrophosphatase